MAVIGPGSSLRRRASTRGVPAAVALDSRARDAAAQVAEIEPFLPAAPDKRQCEFCDFRVVCGPHEPRRTARKPARGLERLTGLREMS